MAAKKQEMASGIIRPECLYSREAFLGATGLSAKRIRDAQREGVEAPWLTVGKRKYIFGSAAIQYVVSLSELERPSLCEPSGHQLQPLVARPEERIERTRLFGLGVN
jgi:hypothetical protein